MARCASVVACGVTSSGIGLVLGFTVALTSVRADTLSGALINAYQNNPQLNSQRAVVRATDESVPQALSGYKPTATATAQTAQQYTSTVSKIPRVRGGFDYPRTSFESSPSSLGV